MQLNAPYSPKPIFAAGLAILAMLPGCDYPFPGKPDLANRPVPENRVLDFDQLFTRNCAGCHGAKGKLGPAPPLNDLLFLAIVPDEELLKVLHHGRTGTPMPPFAQAQGGPLADDQIQALVTGLKSQWLKQEPSDSSPPRYLLADPQSVSALPGDAERGAEVFERACSNCHGENGQSEENPLHDAAFLALISDQALRRIIITGRPDLGMPNYHETDGRSDEFKPLTSAEIDDLVALLARWRNEKPLLLRNSNANNSAKWTR
jgi:mono/diheme cytochrome c family protein